MIPTEPAKIDDKKYRFDSFENGNAFLGNKKGRLPAMGWNSWNAFGSGNTQFLTKAMADKIIELGLSGRMFSSFTQSRLFSPGLECFEVQKAG